MNSNAPVESYRQAIRNNKVMRIIAVVQSVAIVALVVLVATLFPLKTTEVKLYEFSSSGQTFYRIDDAQKLMSRKTALIRFAMREYVVDKESVNHLTETDRFKRVTNMSNAKVFDEFKNRYRATEKSFENKKRKITIELDTPFANDWSQQVHIIDFSTTDTDASNADYKTYWQATVSYTFNEQKIKLDDLIHNPLGLEVVSYSINKRNSINDL